MDWVDYIHTKKSVIRKVYLLYLQGLSVEEIEGACSSIGDKTINNIIDCTNFIYN